MTSRGRPLDVLVRAARDPLSTIRRVRARKLRVLYWLTNRWSARTRLRIYGPVERLADLGLRKTPDAPIAAPLRAIALYGEGRTADAAAYVMGTGMAGRRSTRMRLIRVALAAGDSAAAATVLDRLPPGVDGDGTIALRGELALLTGRYRQAVSMLRQALERQPGAANLVPLLARAESEAAVLTPGWRPALGGPTPLPERRRGRVLHLLTNSLPHRQGGYTFRAQSVARCQIGVGLDPQLVTRAGFPLSAGVVGAPAREVVDGVTYHRLLPNLAPGLGPAELTAETARAAVPLIESLRPALLQATSNHLNAQVALALAEKFGLPVVYEVRGFLEETWRSQMRTDVSDSDRYQASRGMETECMRAAGEIVTLSETMKADIVGRGGIDPAHVTVIPNAVDVDRFRPGPRDDDLAAQLGIDPGEVVIGYISSFTAYEGIRYLIEAVGLLRGRGRRVRLLLVGDGNDRSNLEATIVTAGLDDGTVILTGRVPHDRVERYYRTIDVFVVPRTADRVSQLVTPLKPYEAMAVAKALVVSGVDALREIVDEGKTGMTFRPEDAADLADVLDRLVDDPALRARLGAAAREWVAGHRTWAINGRRYRELYERLDVA